MATLTFEVPDAVAAALRGRKLDLTEIEGLLRDTLYEITTEMHELVDRNELTATSLRSIAARISGCAEAPETVE